jgi:hypothetical protein
VFLHLNLDKECFHLLNETARLFFKGICFFIKEFSTMLTFIVELKYQLMPYVYTQAAICSKNGLPELKAQYLRGEWKLINDVSDEQKVFSIRTFKE